MAQSDKNSSSEWSQKRSLAREYCFNFLYYLQLTPEMVAGPELDDALTDFQDSLLSQKEDQDEDEDKDQLKRLIFADLKYAKSMIEGIVEKQTDLIKTVTPYLKNWKWEKLNPVDRILLLQASYEIEHQETPVKVTINEAIELAKKYGTEQSASFINGVLDQIAKQNKKKDNK